MLSPRASRGCVTQGQCSVSLSHPMTPLSLRDCPFPHCFLSLQGQSRARPHGHCCEECVSPARSCLAGGILRYPDEMWKGSACEFCVCDQGQVTCQMGECAKVACGLVRCDSISICAVAAPSSRWWVFLLPWQQRGCQADGSHF